MRYHSWLSTQWRRRRLWAASLGSSCNEFVLNQFIIFITLVIDICTLATIVDVFILLRWISISAGVAVVLTILTVISEPILAKIFGDGSVEVISKNCLKICYIFNNWYVKEVAPCFFCISLPRQVRCVALVRKFENFQCVKLSFQV